MLLKVNAEYLQERSRWSLQKHWLGKQCSLWTLSPNSSSPCGLQRPQTQAKKPDYLHDSPANVYFFSLKCCVFLYNASYGQAIFLVIRTKDQNLKTALARAQWKMKLPPDHAGSCPEVYPTSITFFSLNDSLYSFHTLLQTPNLC